MHYEGKHRGLDTIQKLCMGCVIQRHQKMADKEKENDNDEVWIDYNNAVDTGIDDNELNKKYSHNNVNESMLHNAEKL